MRQLDSNQDWTFGAGVQNYLTGNAAITQCIQTRLSSFLGDCFFDVQAGIDWFGFLGGKNPTALNVAVSAVILNTSDPVSGQPLVLSLNQLDINVTNQRKISISYQVQTVYSTTGSTFEFDLGGGI